MNGLGTDVVALACILGGATMSGAATLAARSGDGQAVDVACAVEMVESPNVVVALGEGREHIVVAPRVRVHASHACANAVSQEVHVRMEAAQHEMLRAQERAERAQERMERARERIERAQVRVRRVDGLESEELRRQLEAMGEELKALKIEGLELEGLGELIEAEVQAEIEGNLHIEMELLKNELERSGNDAGR
ncbi:MAG: hypothetical protein P8170_12985 [Gemmatimonadota bacterium]